MRRLCVLIVVLAVAGPAAGQTAVLGDPSTTGPLFDLRDPLRPLGPPDQPFPPFAPLGPPPSPVAEGIGTRFGLGVLAGRFGMPGYGLTGVPGQPVVGQPTDLTVLRNDLSLFAPIDHDGDDTGAVGVGIHNSSFWTSAVLPNSHRPFPGTLWDIEAGAMYAHRWDNGWTSGIAVTAGSASDRPFTAGNVMVGGITVYNAFPADGPDAWVLGVNYAPFTDTPYPLPVVFYFWQPSERLQMGIGAPFFVRWKAAPRWEFEALWIPVRTVNARLTWTSEERPGFHAFGAFAWENETYLLANRTDNTERFFAYDKRLFGGVQFDLPYQLRLELSAGYMFDRFYFTGYNYTDKNHDRVNVGSGLFGSVQLRLRF